MLQQGESPAYVQRQLGHASIQLTVDTYGKWLPLGNKAAVNRLDDEGSGSKTVAKTLTGTPGVLEVPVRDGGPSRTRTLDPLIKSPFRPSFRRSHSIPLRYVQCYPSTCVVSWISPPAPLAWCVISEKSSGWRM